MALFSSLSERFNHIFSKLTKRGRLTELEIKEAMREVRIALLEADVNYMVAKDFIKKVSEKAVGDEVMKSLTPAQQVIKIVRDELTELMSSNSQKLTISSAPPTIIMLCGLQGAGKTTLRLEARITNTDYTNVGIKLTVLSPQTVDVVFDTVGEKTLPVTTDTSGITIADGFTLNRITTTPNEVTLTGPTSELDKISEVVAPVSHEGSLSDSVSATASLELRDENGDIVTPEYTTLDSNTADINLTVYQVRELPLSIVFINAPSGFDTSYLKYSLSIPTLNVAGPAKTVGALTELSVAAFDLGREFAFDRDYQKNIELPAGVVSLDGVSAVTIRFDTTDMTSRTFTVTNIRTVNVPSTIDLEVLTAQIHQVTLYGPKSEMEELSADSILAQVDCQNLAVSVGQQTVAASIQVPSSSHIFAVGNYTVQCQASSQ